MENFNKGGVKIIKQCTKIFLDKYRSKKYVIDNSFKLFGEHFTMHSLNAVLNKEKSEYKGYYFSRKMEVNINGK